MAENDLVSIAHLLRRAGFGATRAELEAYAARGYEEVVEELLYPERAPGIDDDLLERYWDGESINVAASAWMYRMINSRRPLEEPSAVPERGTLDASVLAEASMSTETALTLLRQLPPDQGEVIALRVIAGLDVSRVAAITGKRPGTVRVLAHRGLRRLKDVLDSAQ